MRPLPAARPCGGHRAAPPVTARALVAIALLAGAAGCPLSDDYVIGAAGGPGAGGAIGAGGAGGDGAAGGASACAGRPPPQGGDCPAACTGGCAGGVCTIDCLDEDACDAVIRCPAGRPCAVNCIGEQVCKQATVECPDEHGCSIDCKAPQACQKASFYCGASGRCQLTCGDGQACQDSRFHCGGGDCAATCARQPEDDLPAVACPEAGACGCQGC